MGTDRPVAPREADIGAGIMVPTYATGPHTHGWWAMAILLVVTGMIFLMAVFSYLYLHGIHPGFWIDPPALVWLAVILGACGAAIGLALVARIFWPGTTLWTPPTLILLAAGALIVSFVVDLSPHETAAAAQFLPLYIVASVFGSGTLARGLAIAVTLAALIADGAVFLCAARWQCGTDDRFSHWLASLGLLIAGTPSIAIVWQGAPALLA